jgi:alkylation response protein AidB-like acyl-CoA dehydrogenase
VHRLVKVTTMTDLSALLVQQTLDVAPPLLPATVLRNDADAIAAAHELAEAIRPDAAVRDRERQLPWAEIERFSQSGLGSIAVPRAYGGPQVSFVTVAKVFAILSAADPAVGQIPQNHFGILNSLIGSASEAQKTLLFKSVLNGARIGNGGPERGTKNTLDVKTRLTADGDHFLLNGRKFYSTGALFAHWVAVKAINDDGKQVLVFVPRGTPACTSSTIGPASGSAPPPVAACCWRTCESAQIW